MTQTVFLCHRCPTWNREKNYCGDNRFEPLKKQHCARLLRKVGLEEYLLRTGTVVTKGGHPLPLVFVASESKWMKRRVAQKMQGIQTT